MDLMCMPVARRKGTWGLSFAVVEEVQRLSEAGFIQECLYPKWISNVVLIKSRTALTACVLTSQP